MKTGLPLEFPRDFQNKQTTVTSSMQQMEIQLVILFLSKKKFHAKQICLLSSSMKLGPELKWGEKIPTQINN